MAPLYWPNPELGPYYIPGINPSIARLVLALNAWGVKTINSHAGFYPGDYEEQEYWIQKRGRERRDRNEYEGPIVLAGVGHEPPYVLFWATKDQIEKLKALLPDGWVIENYESLKPREELYPYRLTYSALQFFSDATDAFWEEYFPLIYPDPEDDPRKFSVEEVQAINQKYQKAMPLTMEEYNHIRDKAIQQLSETLLDDIKRQEKNVVKDTAERIIMWAEDAELLDCLISIMEEELGDELTHRLLHKAESLLTEMNLHE